MKYKLKLSSVLIVTFIVLLPISGKAFELKDSTLINHFKHRQPHQFILKTNPLALFWGAIPYTSEFRLIGEMTKGLNQSAQLGVSYLGKSPFLTILEGANRNGTQVSFEVTGIRLQGSYKFYFKKYTAPVGWYFSPLASFATATIIQHINTIEYRYNATHFNVNLLMGHQRVYRNSLALDWFFGFGRKDNSWYGTSTGAYNRYNYTLRDINYFGKRVNAVLGISFGYSF
jgi:hypothetical protein